MGKNKMIPFPEGHISWSYDSTNKDKRDVARSILKYHFKPDETEVECPKCLGTGIDDKSPSQFWNK